MSGFGPGPHGPHLAEELSGLLDGELSAEEAAAARGHLAQCALCTAELAAYDRVRAEVRALPHVDPLDPPGLLRLPDPAVAEGAARRPVAAALAGVAAAAAVVLLQLAPLDRPVAPKVTRLVEVHATAGVNDEPTQLAPGAVPVSFNRP